MTASRLDCGQPAYTATRVTGSNRTHDSARTDPPGCAKVREDYASFNATGADEAFAAVSGQLGLIRSHLALLDSRMTIVEGQLTEALGRLRIIAEQLATHTHPEAP